VGGVHLVAELPGHPVVAERDRSRPVLRTCSASSCGSKFVCPCFSLDQTVQTSDSLDRFGRSRLPPDSLQTPNVVQRSLAGGPAAAVPRSRRTSSSRRYR
jgi:hypothetical protein